jgi:hypothetical protein
MVESRWFQDDETIYPEIIERKGVSMSIRGHYAFPVVEGITVPKHRAFNDYMYDAVRVFYGDTKSALLRNAREKANKYKDEFEDVQLIQLKIKGMDIVVMYALEKQIKRKTPKYTVREVKSKYSRL